jgi:hypothetical protein
MYSYPTPNVYGSSTIPRRLDIQCAQEFLHGELIHAASIRVHRFYASRDGYRMLGLFCTYPHPAVHANGDVQGKLRAEKGEQEVTWVEKPGKDG